MSSRVTRLSSKLSNLSGIKIMSVYRGNEWHVSFWRSFTFPTKTRHYIKVFHENTKENSERDNFDKFYVLNLDNVIEWHLAAILRSSRFFWHPYWHIHPWHMADAICDNYVINAKNGIIDIIAYDICHGWICQYGCQKNRQDLRIVAICHSLTFWRFKT